MENFDVVELDVLNQSNDILGTQQQSTTSANPAHYGFNEKEPTPQLKLLALPHAKKERSLILPRVVASAQQSPKRGSQREKVVSVDELRLLGERPKIDPEAVMIVRPSTKQFSNYKRGQSIPSGFKPRNTLTETSSAPQVLTRSYFVALPTSKGRKRTQLDIEVSVGDNVKSESQELKPHSSPTGEPHPKRTKLASPHKLEGYSDPPSSNDYDILHINHPQLRFQEPRNQVYRNHSLSSDFDINGNVRSSARVSEFTKLEQTMNSNPQARKKTKSRRTGSRGGSAISPDTSPPQAPVEVVLHSAVRPSPRRSNYKGTARTDPSIAVKSGPAVNGGSQYETGGKSRFFPSPDLPAVKPLHSELDEPRIALPRETRAIPLRYQFQDCRGKRRNSDVRNLSSDELESGTTVGNHAVVNLSSPGRTSRSTSLARNSASSMNAVLPEGSLGGLAPSTIPSTKWTGQHRSRQATNRSNPSVKIRQEEEELWGIDLVSISRDQTVIQGPDLGLEFNSKDRVYQVKRQGKKQNPSFQIDPKNIRKVVIAKGCTKLRLEISVNKPIDIETSEERNVSELLTKIKTVHLPTIECKPSEWLSKAFAHRLAEETKFSSKTPRRAGEDIPLDVQMAKLNKQRRDDAQTAVKAPHEHTSKRQRPRLLDGMRSEECQKARDQVGLGQLDIKDEIDNIIASKSSCLDRDPLDVSKLSRRIHQGSPNPHLSGSRIQPHRHSKEGKRLSTVEETLQKFIRHKPADLGTPWKKPLLFPKNGKKKASVEFSDLERLEENEFLNDNLIGFYLRYLEERLEETRPEVAKRVYFFNTFFFASLTNTQRGKRGINYEAVEKWTRSVDIFAFDYVIVPINESAHWYLAIICNLPALLPGFVPAKSSAEIKDTYDEQFVEGNDIAAAFPLGQPSSPISEAKNTEPVHSTINGIEGEPELEDQAPTASFAEMSLEGDHQDGTSIIDSCASNFKAKHPATRTEEQGMLDAQINDDLGQVTAQTSETAPSITKDAELIGNGEDTVSPQEQKVHASAKKRKRKSVPPITKINPDSPAIITFDSLGLSHWPTTKILKDYLRDEGRAKRGLDWDELPIKGVTAKDIPLQDNFCDCGLFLLGYVDKFLDNPREFTSRILARQYDVERDWPRLNPSLLRISIRKQIIDLHKEQQLDHKENANKSHRGHSKEPSTEGRSDVNDSAHVEVRRKEPQSLHPTSPQRQSSPQPAITPRRGMTKKEALESAIEIGSRVETKIDEPQSPNPVPPSRHNSPLLELNPRRGLSKKEALETAIEIGAPEPQKSNDTIEGSDNEQNTSFSEDSTVSEMIKPQHGYDLDDEPSSTAANNVFLENEGIRQVDNFYQLSPSFSVDSADVVDHAQEEVEMPSVIEDSQPDFFQELSLQKSFTSLPQMPIRIADYHIEQDQEREKLLAPTGRPTQGTNSQKQRESSIIELD